MGYYNYITMLLQYYKLVVDFLHFFFFFFLNSTRNTKPVKFSDDVSFFPPVFPALYHTAASTLYSADFQPSVSPLRPFSPRFFLFFCLWLVQLTHCCDWDVCDSCRCCDTFHFSHHTVINDGCPPVLSAGWSCCWEIEGRQIKAVSETHRKESLAIWRK